MSRGTTTDPLYFGGPEYEPINSRSWRMASKPARQAYYARLGRLLHAELDRQLELGIGADGRRMARRLKRRRDGATGAVLSPHRSDSRSRRLLKYWPTDKGVRFNWLAGWREIVDYHGNGLVIGAPIRDIRGVTQAGQKRAVAKAREEWRMAHPFDRLPDPPGGAPAFAFPRTPRRPLAPPLTPAAQRFAQRFPGVAPFLVPPQRRQQGR